MTRSFRAATVALAAVIAASQLPMPAAARENCGSVAKKKSGLGGLLSAVGNGDIKGALRSADRAADGGCATETKQASASAAGSTPTATERARKQMADANLKYPSRIPIPAEWKTAKETYDQFGKVRCSDCEGGYAYSGWVSWPRDEYSSKYNGNDARLGNLPIGHVHRWNGNGFAGSLTVVGEEQVNGFRCRKLTYRLQKGGQSAERPGLICWGKASEYSGSDSWVGVF